MDSIYTSLVSCVHGGLSFHIDFEKRNMKVNSLYFIKNGEWDKDKLLLPKELQDCDVLKTIEELYFEYKHSLPNERSDSKRKKYFKALPIEEIHDALLFTAEYREVACARLEGFILCSILNGTLIWDESWGSWYWQSKEDADLILLRKWIENK